MVFNRPYWLRDSDAMRFANFDPATAIIAGVGLVGSVIEADAQSDALKANAQIAAQNAELAKKQAEFEERRTRQETERVLSAQRAAAGASGSALEGSALAILSETAYEGEIDALFIRETGLINASRYTMQANSLNRQANAALIGGILGGAGGVVKGFGNAGNLVTP